MAGMNGTALLDQLVAELGIADSHARDVIVSAGHQAEIIASTIYVEGNHVSIPWGAAATCENRKSLLTGLFIHVRLGTVDDLINNRVESAVGRMYGVDEVSRELPRVIISSYRIGAHNPAVFLGWIDLVNALRDENHSSGWIQVKCYPVFVVEVLDPGIGVEHGCPKSGRAAWSIIDPGAKPAHRVNWEIRIEANRGERPKAAIDE